MTKATVNHSARTKDKQSRQYCETRIYNCRHCIKALQTDKVQLIKTWILHPGLGYTTYRRDCKPNSLNLLQSGTPPWVKQGQRIKVKTKPKIVWDVLPNTTHSKKCRGSSSRYSSPKLTFYCFVPSSATRNKYKTIT